MKIENETSDDIEVGGKETGEFSKPILILDAYLEAFQRIDRALAKKLRTEPRSEEIWDQFRDEIRTVPTFFGVFNPNLARLYHEAADEIMGSIMKSVEENKENYSPDYLYFLGFQVTAKKLFDLIAEPKKLAAEELTKQLLS